MVPVAAPATTTLDASQFIKGSVEERTNFARDLVSCLEKDGFVKIRNHGIPSQDIKDMFSWNKQFFDLAREAKLSCAHAGGPRPVRGFNDGNEKSAKTHPSNEGVLDAKDSVESLNFGPIHDTRYPNQWIDEDILPTFRHQVETFYATFHQTSKTLLEAIELGLDLPAGSMLSRTLPDPSELRLNHYPSILKHQLCGKNVRRIWPHTDFGIITLLVQDSEGGLEFEDRTNPGTFIPVTSEDLFDLIVNVSDILQRWTNGVLKAGLHRVSVPRQFQVKGTGADCMLPDRYSLVFFQRPGDDESAGPIRHFVTEERPACYDEVSALEHLKGRNRLLY